MRKIIVQMGAVFAAQGLGIGRQGAHAQANVQFTYDDLGRLKTATYSNGTTIAYGYDPAGNRTQVVTTGGAAPAPSGTLSANPSSIAPGSSSA